MFNLKSKFIYENKNRPKELLVTNLFPYILYLKKIKKNYLIADTNLLRYGFILGNSQISLHHHFHLPIINKSNSIIHSFDEDYNTNHYPSVILDGSNKLISCTDNNNNIYITNLITKEKLFNFNLNNYVESPNNNFSNKEILNFENVKYFYFRIKIKNEYKIACMSSNDYNFKNLQICKILGNYQNCENFFHFKYNNDDFLLGKFIDNNNEIIMTLKIISPYTFEEAEIMFNFKNSINNLEIIGYDPTKKNKFSIKINEDILNLSVK